MKHLSLTPDKSHVLGYHSVEFWSYSVRLFHGVPLLSEAFRNFGTSTQYLAVKFMELKFKILLSLSDKLKVCFLFFAIDGEAKIPKKS